MSFQFLSAGNDYSQFIASRLRQLKHVWRLNQPQVLEFSISSKDKTFGAFGVPARDDTVALHTDKFGNNTFKGFINSTPKARVLGYNTTAPIFVYDFTSISEEYQLNILSARLSVVPNLTGRKSGDIIKIMTEFLLSGVFDVTNIDDGEFQPDFEIKSGEIWSDVVKRLAENDGFHYWVLNGKIFYKPLGDAPFGASYDLNTDPAITGWNVSLMNPSPVASPIKNDIIVVGGDAPKGFGKAHFIGDGFEGNFRLQSPMFGFEENKILDDSWVNGNINDSVWELVDPTSAVQVGVPNLQIIGGSGLGATFLRLHRALELGGQLRLIHGELQFTAASDGRIGGLYKNFTGLTDADLVAGFKLSKNAAQTDIQAMVDGVVAGSIITTQTDHTYVLITRILGPGPFVFLRRFASKNSTTGFGGFGPLLVANVIFEVWDFNIVASQQLLDPVITRIHEASIDFDKLDSPFLSYTLFQAVDLHIAINFTQLNSPIPIQLRTALPTLDANGLPTSWASFIERPVGFGIDRAHATIGSDRQGHVLQFYNEPIENIPVSAEKIDVRFNVLGTALGRVRDKASVAALVGTLGAQDDGVRTEIHDDFKPPPRTDEDARNAAAARLQDALLVKYNADYTVWDNYVSVRPMPGRFMLVDEERFEDSPRNLLVLEVSDEMLGDTATLTDRHKFDFKLDTRRKVDVMQEFLRRKEAKRIPVRNLVEIDPIDVLELGSTLLDPELSDWSISPLDSDTLRVTINNSLGGRGVEIRKWDRGWGQIQSGTDAGLIVRGAVGVTTLDIPRISRQQIIFMKMYEPQTLGNPSFERVGLFLWISSTGSDVAAVFDNTKSHDGKGYATISASATALQAADSSGAKRFFPVVTGEVINFSGWGFREAGATPNTCRTRVQTFNSSKVLQRTLNGTTIPQSSYGQSTGSLTVAAGEVFVIFEFFQDSDGSVIVLRCDEAQLDIASHRLYSDHSAFAKIGFPLVPVLATGLSVIAITPTALTFDFDLPTTNFHDIWRVLVRIQGGAVLESFIWDFTAFEFIERVFEGTFGRTQTIEVLTYNLFGETNVTPPSVLAEKLAPVISSLAVDEANQLLTWDVTNGADTYQVQVSDDGTFAGGDIIIDEIVSARQLPLAIENVVQARWFRVLGQDIFGNGSFSSTLAHTYTTGTTIDAIGGGTFNNTNNVESLKLPPDPVTSPTYPSQFDDVEDDLVKEGWQLFDKINWY